MSISDELGKLGDLHQRGTLTDDEFARAKARLLNGAAPAQPETPALAAAINRLRRSPTDRWLGGVCGGLVHTTGLAAWIWRLFFTLLAVCGGTGVLIYLLMWIFVPLEPAQIDGQQGEWRAS